MQSRIDSSMITETISIERRFRGPPTSGHGGYVGGLLASYLDDAAIEVTLKAPVRLDTSLETKVHGTVELCSDGQLIAFARARPCGYSITPSSISAWISSSDIPRNSLSAYSLCSPISG